MRSFICTLVATGWYFYCISESDSADNGATDDGHKIMQTILISFIFIPLIAGVLAFVLTKSVRGICALLAVIVNFLIAIFLFKKEAICTFPWAGFGMDFSLRLDHFSGFIILAAAFFSLLVVIYSLGFFKDKDNSSQFYAYLLVSLSFVNGALLANNLIILLFFWEGLLLTLFGMIAMGGRTAFKTATKAFVIVAISDLCLMAGIALTGYLAKTLMISEINLPLGSLGSLAFILLAIGAVSKAGSMPFHSWIPDAAQDAPLPFMAILPASLEKLLGIYFLSRICLEMFKLNPDSWLSIMLMIVGAITIFLAVMMALIQQNYKKLLSYHAISQVGYMILGIGTALPIGIVGGLFHMLNHALYKSCLFLTAGSVEKQVGTTDLEKLGGLIKKMPLTFVAFAVAALSISGVPPFNGFFSKELIYHAARDRGVIFYVIAVAGAFLTAASFLKLGHAVFLGKPRQEIKDVKEAPVSMLMPMGILALTCVIFGIFNYLPLNSFIQPILGERLKEYSLAGSSGDWVLVLITLAVLLGALAHHLIAVKISGNALKAADHIHYSGVFSVFYSWAEKKYFDPYAVGIKLINKIAKIFWSVDRAIDWVYASLITNITFAFSRVIHKIQAGYYIIYVVWSLVGAFAVMSFVLR
ncbi:MAG: proton-conducting transporter membrane subunit [Candidatus Omnitrophica bacterium]|nr:proton-conducting transporter membrane subunit [Candidatus Omnitrophota bacterium]